MNKNLKATTVAIIDGQTVMTYYGTAIVRLTPTHVTLDHGGSKTATTKRRMNQFSNEHGLGYQVYQLDGEWFVFYRGVSTPFKDRILHLKR